ncbi:MAG: TetR family transcriptional regulator C-terminal domain-containing protein, partial [Bacteroidota bacterium]
MGYKHDKENILRVGYDQLRKNGYHNVGINQILQASGIPKGSFYNFFQSKEDFAAQVIGYYGQSNLEWLQEYFTHEGSMLQRLKDFYQLMIEGNKADNFSSGCLINNMSIEIGSLNPRLAAVADDFFRQWVGVLSEVVRKGQEQGEIIAQHPAQELAEYLHAGFSGTLARMKVTQSTTYMETWLR